VAHVHVRVLGPARVRVDGVEARLTPLTIRLLVRLVAAEGEVVTARQLYRDVWGLPVDLANHGQRSRNEVQKRILELRRTLDPEKSGEGARFLRTEQMLNGREPESAYRLALDRDQLDASEFADLVNHAALVALDLWRGKPLADAGDAEFAGPLVRRLTRLHEIARSELIRIHTEFGDFDRALPLAVRIAEENPDDSAAHLLEKQLRDHLRTRHGDEILRREFPGLRTTLVIRRGDLFDQDDANLVVGFGDTFDTSTERDIVISRESVQGQLLHRIYGGDVKSLDHELRRGLRMVTPIGTETQQAKPKGKRTRYAIGTVVPIMLDGRRIFAVAYARQGNDLVTRSTADDLRVSLERLWTSIAVHGLLKPVAIALVGSGLARITELNREQLLIMIIESFLQGCREESTVTVELRISILPRDLRTIRMSEIERFLDSLGPERVGTA
jgi:hypothetical protein